MDLEELRALLELRLGVCDIDDSAIVYTETEVEDGFQGKIKLDCMDSMVILGSICLTAEEAKESTVMRAIGYFQGHDVQDGGYNDLPAPAVPRKPGKRSVDPSWPQWEAAQAALRTLVGREISAPADFDWQTEEYDDGFQATLTLPCLGDVVFDSLLVNTAAEAQESAASMALEYCNDQLEACADGEAEKPARESSRNSVGAPRGEAAQGLERKRLKVDDGKPYVSGKGAPRRVPPPLRPHTASEPRQHTTWNDSQARKPPLAVAPRLVPMAGVAPRRALPPRYGTTGGGTGAAASSSRSVDEVKRRLPPPFRNQSASHEPQHPQRAPLLCATHGVGPVLLRPKHLPPKAASLPIRSAPQVKKQGVWYDASEQHEEVKEGVWQEGMTNVSENNTYDKDKAPDLWEAELMVGETAEDCQKAFHYLLEHHDPESTGITTVWAVRNLIVACNARLADTEELEDLCGRLRNMRWFGDNNQKVCWQKSKNRIQLSKLNSKDPNLIAKWEEIRRKKEWQGRYTQ